jgi:very-short-patch-repair endonuclease
MKLTRKLLIELQKKLKIGNRRGVHLNAIPARSAYKFDISRLSAISSSLPEEFLKQLLSDATFKFKISWKDNVPDLNLLHQSEQVQLVRITRSLEGLISQTETIESEKGINTFGFGFPLLIRRDQADNQLTVAPLLIWSLRVRRTKEFNTWEIYRTEEDTVQLNEVLINHLQNDAQVRIPQIPDEMLEDGLISHKELADICCQVLESINTKVNAETKKVVLNNLQQVVPVKDKKHYEGLPLGPNNSMLEFGGLFSIFEVQKQNIIQDYDHLLELEGLELLLDDLKGHVFQPLSAVETDPSQQSILNALGTKRNVLIQGPPGTGKSQSLTAVLVNALENRRKTLVVCEKRTALEVLYEALKARGLEHHCVLIKDISKDRKTVVDSVRSRIGDNSFRAYHHHLVREELGHAQQEASTLINSVNQKHAKLAQQILGSRNWTTVVGQFLRKRKRSPQDTIIPLPRKAFKYTLNEFQALLLKIGDGERSWKAYKPHAHLNFLNPAKLLGGTFIKVEQQLREDFQDYASALQQIESITESYFAEYRRLRGIDLDKQFEKLAQLRQVNIARQQFLDLISLLKKEEFVIQQRQLIQVRKDLQKEVDDIISFYNQHEHLTAFANEEETAHWWYRLSASFSKTKKQVIELQEQFLNRVKALGEWDTALLEIKKFQPARTLKENAIKVMDYQNEINKAFLNIDACAQRATENINFLNITNGNYSVTIFDEVKQVSKTLMLLCPNARTHQELDRDVSIYIGQALSFCHDINLTTSLDNITAVLSSIREDDLRLEHNNKVKKEFQGYELLNDLPVYNVPEKQKRIQFKVNELYQKLTDEAWTTRQFIKGKLNVFLNEVQKLLKDQQDYFSIPDDLFRSEFSWHSFYNSLTAVQQQLINELKPQPDWEMAFSTSYLNGLLVESADGDLPYDDSELQRFPTAIQKVGKEQGRYIQQYWFSQQHAKEHEFARQPHGLTVENLYNKRSSPKFKRLSLRQIVQFDRDLFTTFFPVILTTPDVCSNLFQSMNGYFDIVIFDEASQLRVEENLPAILKGQQVIIAGDEHQMPPSNYFSKVMDGTVEDEEDIEEEVEVNYSKEDVILDCESLLDFGKEMSFDKRYLDFHYRSRHPYLIDFSNYAFYNQRLVPQPNSFNYTPIQYIQVNGTFSDHNNEREADAVLLLLENQIQRLPNGKYPSVGIATFNISQRDLIKAKINDRKKLERYYDFNQKIMELEEDGLFVKNLENIQGDERDVIIISTTYGLKPDGSFAQRFGPLTQSKGYKLLNVIVTRAKYRLFVCSSIPEDYFMKFREHLYTEGSNNKKAVFYAYLAYAKAVSDRDEELRRSVLSALADNTKASKGVQAIPGELESPFEEEVYAALAQSIDASKLIPQMQYAGFRIDLVYDSGLPDVPRIAIECDGAKYHSSNEAYLYDVYRQKILEDQGFVFHRIWSTNWWRNPGRETEKLINFINTTIKTVNGKPNSAKDWEKAFPDDLPEMHFPQGFVEEKGEYTVEDFLFADTPKGGQKSLFGDSIDTGSIVKIKYLNNDEVFNVKIVKGNEYTEGSPSAIRKISSQTPLGKSLLGKVKGDLVKVGDLDQYVEILAVN